MSLWTKNGVNLKKGQMVVWVIVALFLVAAIIIYFLVRSTIKPTAPTGEIDPNPYMQSCVRSLVDDALDLMLPQGGFTSPAYYKMFENTKVTYICSNEGYYKPCIYQHPMLLTEMQDEISKDIQPKVEECFSELQSELEKRGYSVTSDRVIVKNLLGPDTINVEIQTTLTLNKEGSTRNYDKFSVRIKSPAYALASVAMEIASQEAKYCYFEYVGYMALYPRFDIRKVSMSDASKIYTIKDVYSGKTMNIAIRGCAIPGGL